MLIVVLEQTRSNQMIDVESPNRTPSCGKEESSSTRWIGFQIGPELFLLLMAGAAEKVSGIM